MEFQKTNAAATGGSYTNYNSGMKITQERIMGKRSSSWKKKTKNQNSSRSTTSAGILGGWEVKGAIFLETERRTRCIMSLDLQGQVGISTI